MCVCVRACLRYLSPLNQLRTDLIQQGYASCPADNYIMSLHLDIWSESDNQRRHVRKVIKTQAPVSNGISGEACAPNGNTMCVRQQFVNQHDDQYNQNQVTIIVSLLLQSFNSTSVI
jgi:hypothetical protein